MNVLEIAPHWYPVLLLTGMGAGFVDAVGGGGGLISIPTLLALGVPPHMALGTNKLQSSVGSAIATFHYARNNLCKPSKCLAGIFWTALGAGCGVLAVEQVTQSLLERIIAVLLAFVFLILLAVREFGNEDRKPKVNEQVFWFVAGSTLGFYDGFFGPGAGTLWAVALVTLLGMNLKRATAHTKVVNLTSNLVALVFFLAAGRVLLPLGLVMIAGQLLGATLGARLLLRRSTSLVRTFLLAVTSLTIMRLLVSSDSDGGSALLFFL